MANNIMGGAESIQVKDEEIDWLVYHYIAGHDGVAVKELARVCAFSENTVEASLKRLENNLLIECRDRKAYALSINESLIRCQVKYDSNLPYSIENGVIRAKKR